MNFDLFAPRTKTEGGADTTTPTEILLDWWRRLETEDRGGRARLRRCHTLDEVLFVPAFHDLLRRLTPFEADPLRLAAAAGIAVVVKEHTPEEFGAGFARQMGRKEADRRVVSEVRFRQLITVDEATRTPQEAREEAWRTSRRLVRLLGQKVDLVDAARSLYAWNDRTRREWALAYYAA
jgi:CRISPR system Cascade subunit CasB